MQVNVSAETQGTANVTIKPKENDSYQISRNNQSVDVSDIRVSDNIKFNYVWKIDSGQEPKEGDTFQYKLPENITYVQQERRFVSAGSEIGTLKVTSDGNVTFTFKKIDRTSEDGINGSLDVEGQISSNVKNGDSIDFSGFPLNSNSSTSYKIKSDTKSDFVLNGLNGVPNNSRNIINSKALVSEATINQNGSEFNKNSKILTTFDPTMELVKVDVTSGTLDSVNGQFYPKAQLSESDYDLNKEDGSIELHKNTSDTLKVKYYFNINTNKLSYSQINGQEFRQSIYLSDDISKKSDSRVTIPYDSFVTTKRNGSYYNSNNISFLWGSEYNYNHKSLPQNNTLKIDISKNDDSHFLDGNSINLYKVSTDDNGVYRFNTQDSDSSKRKYNPSASDKVNENDYSIDIENNTINITFKNPTQDAYLVTYRTYTSQSNSVSSTSSVKSPEGQNYSDTTSYVISKSFVDGLAFTLQQDDKKIDYQNSNASWYYDIHRLSDLPNQDILIENTMSPGLQLSDNPNFFIRQNNKQIKINSDLTAKDGDTEFKFTILDNGKNFKLETTNVSKRYTIGFDTAFDTSKNQNTNKYIFEVTGNAKIKNLDTDKETRLTSKDNLELNANNMDGFIYSTVDTPTKQIIFDSVVNPSKRPINNSPITNKITNGRIIGYEVYKIELSNDGKIDSSSLSSDNLIKSENFDINQSKQSVEFQPENNSNDIYLLRSIVSWDNMILDSKSSITSTTSKQDMKFSSTVQIPNSGEFLEKTGRFDNNIKNQINWKVTLNKSQSKLDNMKFFDDPVDNQIVDMQSIKINQVSVDNDSNITNSGNTLVQGTDYVVTSSGNNQFTIEFMNSVSKPYIIEYSTTVQKIDPESNYVNSGQLFMNNHILSSVSATAPNPVRGDSEVSFNSAPYSLTLNLRDKENPDTIINGTFILESSDNVTYKGVTNNGSFTFEGLSRNNYKLIQTVADEGYKIAKEKQIDIGISSPNLYELTETILNEHDSDNQKPSSDEDEGKDKNNTGTAENKESSQPDSSSSSESSQSNSSDSDSSIPQDKESSQSSENSHSDSSTSNSTTQSTATQSSTSKPTSNLPQTGQKHNLTLKYVGIIIVLLSGFILYPALKKRR
ncbi:collagen binding domain-containing protein [Holzapfeliella sp. JNUCC 80]